MNVCGGEKKINKNKIKSYNWSWSVYFSLDDKVVQGFFFQ